MIRDEQYLCQGGTNPTHCVNLLTGNSEFLGLFLLKGSFASTVTTNNEVFVFGRDGSYETITLTIDLAQNDLDWLVDRAEARPEGVVPFSWHSGCSTLINSTTILLAGGIQNGTITSKTWLFNFKTEEWTQGPNMIEERTNLGCGLIKSINSVAAFGSTRITEIVKLPGGSFKQGNCQYLFD